jgi:uncharacterized protein (TIGR00661 family)
MSRILYGISGQGFGHAMRSKVILDYLIKQGHEVEVLTHGQAYPYLKDFFSCHEIFGLHLVYKENKVDYLATILQDTKKFPEAVKSFRAMSKLVQSFKPQIVFSDYEPMSALLSHLNRLSLVSVGNHHFITNTKIKYPKKYMRDFVAVKVVTEAMTPHADAYLVTTFAKEQVKGKKTFLFPPIVQAEVRQLKPQTDDYIMMYLTSKYEGLIKTLKAIKSEKFVLYGYNIAKQDENVEFKEFSRQGFLSDLKDCKAVIANAGFTFMSEALYLGKPYLAIPISKQFEQIINAIYLERLGYGEYSMKLTALEIKNFLSQLDKYRARLKDYLRQDNRQLFNKIDDLITTLVGEKS